MCAAYIQWLTTALWARERVVTGDRVQFGSDVVHRSPHFRAKARLGLLRNGPGPIPHFPHLMTGQDVGNIDAEEMEGNQANGPFICAKQLEIEHL